MYEFLYWTFLSSEDFAQWISVYSFFLTFGKPSCCLEIVQAQSLPFLSCFVLFHFIWNGCLVKKKHQVRVPHCLLGKSKPKRKIMSSGWKLVWDHFWTNEAKGAHSLLNQTSKDSRLVSNRSSKWFSSAQGKLCSPLKSIGDPTFNIENKF